MHESFDGSTAAHDGTLSAYGSAAWRVRTLVASIKVRTTSMDDYIFGL
jgi:hypothetical protein